MVCVPLLVVIRYLFFKHAAPTIGIRDQSLGVSRSAHNFEQYILKN